MNQHLLSSIVKITGWIIFLSAIAVELAEWLLYNRGETASWLWIAMFVVAVICYLWESLRNDPAGISIRCVVVALLLFVATNLYHAVFHGDRTDWWSYAAAAWLLLFIYKECKKSHI